MSLSLHSVQSVEVKSTHTHNERLKGWMFQGNNVCLHEDAITVMTEPLVDNEGQICQIKNTRKPVSKIVKTE